MPEEIPLDEIEDEYAYYVLILGIPEQTFWNEPVHFVRGIAANKAAFDLYVANEQTRIQKESRH